MILSTTIHIPLDGTKKSSTVNQQPIQGTELNRTTFWHKEGVSDQLIIPVSVKVRQINGSNHFKPVTTTTTTTANITAAAATTTTTTTITTIMPINSTKTILATTTTTKSLSTMKEEDEEKLSGTPQKPAINIVKIENATDMLKKNNDSLKNDITPV